MRNKRVAVALVAVVGLIGLVGCGSEGAPEAGPDGAFEEARPDPLEEFAGRDLSHEAAPDKRAASVALWRTWLGEEQPR
jgi:hypothetical protein